MEEFKEKIGFISSIVTIVGFITSIVFAVNLGNVLIFILGILMTLLIVAIIISIKRIRKMTVIDGYWIQEADNIPKLVPKKNILNPISINHKCQINGSDAVLEYTYYGICRSKKGSSGFMCSADGQDIRDIDELGFYAYDLKHNPQKTKKINPILLSPKSSTKRLKYKFLKRVDYNKSFHIYTYQKYINSVRLTGKDSFTSTVLFANRPIDEYKVELEFLDSKPKSVEVYKVHFKKAKYLYSLECKNTRPPYTYTDDIHDETAWSIRVYVFSR